MGKAVKRQVPWTKTLLEEFVNEAMLSEDEEFVMRTRISGWSIVKQSMELNVSTSTISNIVNSCKEKYDIVSKHYPDRFPPRKESKVEHALDVGERTPIIGELCRKCKLHDLNTLSALELLDCQDNCHFKM